MTILRGMLSAMPAVFVGLLVPGLFALNNSKATGLAAVVGGFLESFFSPPFWILAVLFFALFFAASRLSSKPLRIFLFQTPGTAISILGLLASMSSWKANLDGTLHIVLSTGYVGYDVRWSGSGPELRGTAHYFTDTDPLPRTKRDMAVVAQRVDGATGMRQDDLMESDN